jgi:hypothetical protein
MHPTLDPLVVSTLSAVCSHPRCPTSIRERLSGILMTGEDPGLVNAEMTRMPVTETWYMVYFWALRTVRGKRPVDRSLFSVNTLQTLARVYEPDHP